MESDLVDVVWPVGIGALGVIEIITGSKFGIRPYIKHQHLPMFTSLTSFHSCLSYHPIYTAWKTY